MAHKLTLTDTKNLENHLIKLFSQPYGIVDLAIYGVGQIRPRDFEVSQFNCGKPLSEQFYSVRFKDNLIGEKLNFDEMVKTIEDNVYA